MVAVIGLLHGMMGWWHTWMAGCLGGLDTCARVLDWRSEREGEVIEVESAAWHLDIFNLPLTVSMQFQSFLCRLPEYKPILHASLYAPAEPAK